MEPEYCVQADIDLSALRHNLGVVRRHAARSRVMAVVKSLAYGHGAEQVAAALEPGVDALAVARIEEGVALRQAGIRGPLVVLEGGRRPLDLQLAHRHELQLVLHAPHQLQLLEADPSRDALGCWLKVDTGMHRLGIAPEEVPYWLERLGALAGVRLQGIMTHLANADDTGDPATPRQLEVMDQVSRGLGLPRSIANSAGILAWPGSHAEWVRPGLMLYGASPLGGRSAAGLGLRPVMTLSAPLLAVRTLPGGAAVGYGGTWRTPQEMPVGVVGIGYGDGYPRHLREAAEVLLHGARARVLGRVSMDMISIDLRGIRQAAVGDRVTLWGEGLPVEELAARCETIPYTLLCGVTPRVERRYRN